MRRFATVGEAGNVGRDRLHRDVDDRHLQVRRDEHPPGVVRRAWPGAIVALTAWLVVSWGFGVYVTSLGRYALFYGSLATVAVLLVWFYLTSWALLIGAELNAQLEGLRDKPRRR